MWFRVAIVRTDVAEERIASIIRKKGIRELGTTLTITSNRNTLRRNADSTGYKRAGGRGRGLRGNVKRGNVATPEIPLEFVFLEGYMSKLDRLYDPVVRVHGYRPRGSGFDSWRYQIFWVAMGQLSLVRTNEELLESESSGSGLENWG
jgi:hypothetical protein